jgi:glycosyltransferase involved in cell wall biosynthesis
MRNIAIFCHNLEINGANFFVLTLIKAVIKHAHVTIFTPSTGAMESKFSLTGALVLELGENYDFASLQQFDTVLINTLMMSSVVLECDNRNIPHVLIVHETWAPDKIDFYLNQLWNIRGVHADDIRAALRRSRKVVYPAKYLEQVYDSLVDNTRRDTIYCTIEMDLIDKYMSTKSRQRAREECGFDKDDIVFLQVGTLTRRKAQLSSLKALIEAKDKLPSSSRLLFVGARSFRPGEREYINEIQSLVEEHDLKETVQIHNVTDDIYKFYLASDVLIHPSINEVLPLSILEACYFGLPVIVSNLDGMPEVIRDQHDGLLVNPYDISSIADAMSRLASDADLRKIMGESARFSVEVRHSSSTFEEKYIQLITSLIETNQ